MRTMPRGAVAAFLLVIPLSLAAQKQLTDAERAARRQQAEDALRVRNALFDEWDDIVRKESARAEAGQCPDAHTTIDINKCLAGELETAQATYQRFAEIIRKIVGPMADDWTKKFDDAEKRWNVYREALCEAAYEQYKGGTIAPNWAENCEIVAYRSHINELHKTFRPIVR